MIINLLLIAHIFGDFLLQTESAAVRKTKEIGIFIRHAAVYALCIGTAAFLYLDLNRAVLLAASLSLIHAGAEALSSWRIKRAKKTDDLLIFLVPQIALSLAAVAAGTLVSGAAPTGFLTALIKPSAYDSLNKALILSLMYLACLSPTAVLVKTVFKKMALYRDDEEDETSENNENAGYAIGILERVIIVTLGLAGQLGTIGFVLAAKSLARFSQLSDKRFAEKYLIGTLTSVLAALLCFLAGKNALHI